MTVTALLSVGMVLVIVTGNIDLSVGRLAGFVSVVVAWLQAYLWNELSPRPAAAARHRPLGHDRASPSARCTAWSRARSSPIMRVPAFIVTLGSMWILNGLILIRTEGKTIAANQPIFSNSSGRDTCRTWLGWVFAILVVPCCSCLCSLAAGARVKYGFSLAPLLCRCAQDGLLPFLVLGYMFYVNHYTGCNSRC